MTATELRKLMKQYGWSAFRVAYELDISDRTVRRWLNNHTKAPPFLKLALLYAHEHSKGK